MGGKGNRKCVIADLRTYTGPGAERAARVGHVVERDRIYPCGDHFHVRPRQSGTPTGRRGKA